MIKPKYKVIGVMSGTSLDGLDLVYAEFVINDLWSSKIIVAETIQYSEKWSKILKNLVSLSLDELSNIDKQYTSYLASAINDFITKNQISDLDVICSHGHTALHQPEKGLTYQIGNMKELNRITGNIVVCDFRIQDVEFGGQGAPLVPIGDALLFTDYDFCLNLGGFANVSLKMDSSRIAYDICPVNIVLNHYVSNLGLEYDDQGKVAESGMICNDLLSELNANNYYQMSFPKSLGLEWVKSEIIPIIDSFKLKTQDILRTFVEHIAIQISNEINKKENSNVLITGGGVYNKFLIQRLQNHSTNSLEIPSDEIIEYKEALIFGLLGVLKLRGENNCLSSVTGAIKDHSSGKIYYP